MTVGTLAAPEIISTVDGYRVTWTDLGVEASAEWVEQKGRELTCELVVRSTRPLSEGLLLAPAAFNLSAPQTRKNLARQLSERDPDLDWGGMLEQLVVGIRERHRAGEPTIDMRLHQAPTTPLWHVHPFLTTSGPTVMFGDGGSGKTTLAIAIAVTAASGSVVMGIAKSAPRPVLFLDYESNADIFHARLRAICSGAAIDVPAVHYRREYASLPEAASQIRREAERIGVGTVVVDSIGLACGGSPEAADVTLAFFRAVDSLRVPVLCIDHITKNGGDEQTKSYGSVYKHNRPRLAWRVVGRDDGEGRVVALTEHKHNDFKALPALGYRLSFTTDAEDRPTVIEIGYSDPAKARLEGSMRERIMETLLHASKPLLPAQVAAMTGDDRHKVGSRMTEMAKRGDLWRDPSGTGYLVSQREN